MKYDVFGIINTSKYLGTVEADSVEEAQEKADLLPAHISVCHQCAKHFSDTPEISDIQVEPIE